MKAIIKSLYDDAHFDASTEEDIQQVSRRNCFMVEEITANLFRIEIPLPVGPLKALKGPSGGGSLRAPSGPLRAPTGPSMAPQGPPKGPERPLKGSSRVPEGPLRASRGPGGP